MSNFYRWITLLSYTIKFLNYVKNIEEDEVFRLTSKEGKFEVEREKVSTDTSGFDNTLLFEQDPV